MLTAVKNQIKVNLLTLKYAIMREMINKITFFSNIIFMILNNSCMIVQWIVLFSIKSDMGDILFEMSFYYGDLQHQLMDFPISSLREVLTYQKLLIMVL